MSGQADLPAWPWPAGVDRENTTVLSSYEEIKEVFTSRDFHSGWGDGQNAPFRNGTLASIDEEDHLERRRIEAKLFGQKVLARLESEFLHGSIDRALLRNAQVSESEEYRQIDLLRLTREVLLEIVFQLSGLGQPNEQELDLVLAEIRKVSEGSHVHWSPRDPAQVIRDGLEAKESLVVRYIRPRRDATDEQTNDSLFSPNLMDAIAARPDHFSRWDDDLPLREVLMYSSGGVMSPSNSLTHAVAELFTWIDANPSDAGRLTDPDYLRLAIHEALRLHPPGPPKHRLCIRDTVLSTGRRFLAGEHCLLDIAAANRSTDVFGPDANSFRIPRSVNGASPYGLVFGAGPHTCIGKTLVIGRETHTTGPVGVLVGILERLFQLEMRLDPARPPALDPHSPQGNYLALPIVLKV